MGASADALGLPFDIDFQGKKITFAPVDDFEVIALYECHLEEEAWKAVERSRRWLKGDMLARAEEGTRRDIQAGVFSYGSQHYGKSHASLANQVKLILLMAQKYTKDVTEETIRALRKDDAKSVELLRKMGYVEDQKENPSAPQPTT